MLGPGNRFETLAFDIVRASAAVVASSLAATRQDGAAAAAAAADEARDLRARAAALRWAWPADAQHAMPPEARGRLGDVTVLVPPSAFPFASMNNTGTS